MGCKVPAPEIKITKKPIPTSLFHWERKYPVTRLINTYQNTAGHIFQY